MKNLILAEDQLVDQAIKFGKIPVDSQEKKIKDNLLGCGKISQQAFEAMLKGWFEDQENHGMELQESYNRILEMRKKQEPLEQDSEPVNNFMKVLNQALLQRARHFEEMRRGRDQIHPKDFYTAMEDVVMERFDQSVKRLGVVGLYRYQWKNNTKPKTDKKLLQKRKNVKDLLDGMSPLLEKLQSALSYFLREKMLTEEIQKQENEEKLNQLFGEDFPKILKELPFSKEDRKELDKNLKEYQKTHQVEAVYELEQKLFQIYQKNLKSATGHVDKTAEWAGLLKSMKNDILPMEENGLEISKY